MDGRAAVLLAGSAQHKLRLYAASSCERFTVAGTLEHMKQLASSTSLEVVANECILSDTSAITLRCIDSVCEDAQSHAVLTDLVCKLSQSSRAVFLSAAPIKKVNSFRGWVKKLCLNLIRFSLPAEKTSLASLIFTVMQEYGIMRNKYPTRESLVTSNRYEGILASLRDSRKLDDFVLKFASIESEKVLAYLLSNRHSHVYLPLLRNNVDVYIRNQPIKCPFMVSVVDQVRQILGFEPYPCGSAVPFFQDEQSDIDLCVDTRLVRFALDDMISQLTVADRARLSELEECQQHTSAICALLACRLAGSGILGAHACRLIALPFARKPVIRLSSWSGSSQLDISVTESDEAFRAARLLAGYSAQDPRCAQLVRFVKIWSKRRQINGARDGYLSSYAFTLTVISFLIEMNVLHNSERDVRSERNNVSIYELITAYFHHMCYDWNYQTSIVSVRCAPTQMSKYLSDREDWTQCHLREAYMRSSASRDAGILIECPVNPTRLISTYDRDSITLLEYWRACLCLQLCKEPVIALMSPFPDISDSLESPSLVRERIWADIAKLISPRIGDHRRFGVTVLRKLFNAEMRLTTAGADCAEAQLRVLRSLIRAT